MNHAEFAAAYEKGYASTVRYLRFTGVPADRADDLAQAAWVRAWERRKQLREPLRIAGWVNRIGLNLFRNELRRLQPLPYGNGVDVSCRPRVSATTIDVRRAFGRCAPEDRALLQSYYLEGYTSFELGCLIRCSPGAVRVRVLRARSRLRSLFGGDHLHRGSRS
jgi:RNA polymerase sigma-70 factor (ECF subfamily)